MSLGTEVVYKTSTFNYEVIYVYTYDDIERADSRSIIDYLIRGPENITFMPTLMIQLSTSTTVYIFHLYAIYNEWMKNNILNFPPSLKKILSSEIIVKIGFTTHNDTHALFKTYGIQVSKILDMDSLATSLGLGFSSLKDLVSISGLPYNLKGKDEPHDWTINLTIPLMKRDDIEYAALDALVCLELYRLLIPPNNIAPGTRESDDNITNWLKAKNNTKTGTDLSRYIATAFPPWQKQLSLQERQNHAIDYVSRLLISAK